MAKLQPVCAALSYLSAWLTTLLGCLQQFSSVSLDYLSANAPGIGVVLTVMMYLTNVFMQIRRDQREAKLTHYYMTQQRDRRETLPLTEITDDDRRVN